jgi:hypothetical protein
VGIIGGALLEDVGVVKLRAAAAGRHRQEAATALRGNP